jgi:hypothetical protein
MTSKQFLGGSLNKHLGRVDLAGEIWHMRLHHQPGIGCVIVQLRPSNLPKWTPLSGRFGDDASLEHVVSHIVEFNLVAEAKVYPVMEVNPSALAARKMA